MKRIVSNLVLFAVLACSACAKRSAEPLPGDSVSADGAVSLSTPRIAVGRPADPSDAIASRLYPVDVIMDHQTEIGLTTSQRTAITKEVDASQAELVRTQWELQAEKEKLVKILDDAKVDEAAAAQAARSLMVKENAIKSSHLAMLVRIKNVLSVAQQKVLHDAREKERCGEFKP